ncbi:MAG: aldo/keto reductase [Candidatus Protochlamydia sp.]|nr:aldo/keto reductase [Candidatus Protochlamydia sp.]
MKKIQLQSGISLPVLGQGTWKMGESQAHWQEEIEALHSGFDLGMTLVDTAEYYGKAEDLVGEAVKGIRNEITIVSKVIPNNATKEGTLAACERSLRRLKTDYIDIYLLHWKGAVPFSETLEAFRLLKSSGKIRHYGVSNFDLSAMEKAVNLPGGEEVLTNQVLYNLSHRGIEWDLLPWCQSKDIPIMAYSPFDEGRLLNHPFLNQIAASLNATPAQIALAWILQQKKVVAIPKTGNIGRIKENNAALQLKLPEEILIKLNKFFPSPAKKMDLEII